MRKTVATMMIAGAMSLSACGFEWDPCAGAPVPSAQDREAAANGYEVEWEDCELTPDGRWVYDD